MSEFQVIETQEQLDAIIKARVSREREKYADYDTLADKIQNLETENSNLRKAIEAQKESDTTNLNRIAELEKNINTWETKSLKQQIAIKNGIPFELAERLQGDNEESLNADAERLASLVTVRNYTQPLADTEPHAVGDSIESAWRDVVKNLQ